MIVQCIICAMHNRFMLNYVINFYTMSLKLNIYSFSLCFYNARASAYSSWSEVGGFARM